MNSDTKKKQHSRLAWTASLCLSCLLVAEPAAGWALGYPDFLHTKKYSLYEGKWSRMPEMKELHNQVLVGEGTPDLSSLKKDSDYALRYTAELQIPVDGSYLLTQTSGDSCIVSISGERVVVNDGVEGRHSRTVEKLLPLKAGRHAVVMECLLRSAHECVFEFRVEGPDLYKVDRFHWLYFGWQGDFPKSWSFMGGTVVPGRRKRVQFALETDGTRYLPDEKGVNRRELIKWYLADEFMPSPVSEWTAGPIGVRIQHFANRVLNGKATAVYSRIGLTNRGTSLKTVTVDVNAGPEEEVPLTQQPSRSNSYFMFFDLMIPPGGTAYVDFVATAAGDSSIRDLKTAGSFDDNYQAMTAYYNRRIDAVAHPIALPNKAMASLYKAAQIIMWESIVNAENGDVEMRGSGGDPAGYYPYDRTFSHDVPNMVDELIREGDVDVAKEMLRSSYYQRLGRELEQDYLDAIPKYILPYATYLQVSDDTAYFTPDVMTNIRRVARSIHDHRDFQVQGPYRGIMEKSHSLDNPLYYLPVDNFAALHGLVAYHYLCTVLRKTEEAKWAEEEAEDLNGCLNSALSASMERRGTDWYMSTFDDDSYFWKSGYDGNWITTSLMMSTFPWDVFLGGFTLGGTWKDAFDRTCARAIQLRDASPYHIPPGSWGAWWGAEYGACYNAGMGLQLLFSDTYRTEVMRNLQFLLDNQNAPYQWGESFFRPERDNDWPRPAADLETWGLSFTKEALLESCCSVKIDGTVIIGRGVPETWLRDGDVVEWKNICVNGGRKLDFSIGANGKWVTLKLSGVRPAGKVILDIPALKENIGQVEADGHAVSPGDIKGGRIELAPETRVVKVLLLRR